VLLGGKVRDRVRVYWLHCATWRINHPSLYKPAITSLDGVTALGAEVREKGFTALKTNIFLYEGGTSRGWREQVLLSSVNGIQTRRSGVGQSDCASRGSSVETVERVEEA
jgi:L-alanine-DL-glutamate epimerase-like enolase superfamily enzyme